MHKFESNSPAILPLTGKSRWSQFKKFSPVSRETFRKLSFAGKAPKPERMGIRCTFYDNRELHRWLADPANYVANGRKRDEWENSEARDEEAESAAEPEDEE